MKKINMLQLGITLVIILFTYSCKKDVISPNVPTASSTAQQSEILERSQIIERNLLSFKANLKAYESNKNGDSTITYEVDSAVWYLEATLNYTYSNPDDITEERTVESFEVIMNKTIEGTVDFLELQGVYNETVSSLQTIYAASDYNENTLLMCDVKVLSEDAQKVTLSVDGYIGEKVVIGDNGITSGWTWGEKRGYYHTGTYHVAGLADATDVIETRANSILTPYPSTGGVAIAGLRKVILNPIVQYTFIPANSNNGLWNGSSVGLYDPVSGTRKTTLLSANEISQSIIGAVNIANDPQYQGANPPAAAIDVEYGYDLGVYPYPNDKLVYHNINTITYGNVIWVNDNASTL